MVRPRLAGKGIRAISAPQAFVIEKAYLGPDAAKVASAARGADRRGERAAATHVLPPRLPAE